MLIRYFHISIVECSVYVLVLGLQITFFMVNGSVVWLSCLARKIVVCIVSINLHGGEEAVEGPKRYLLYT